MSSEGGVEGDEWAGETPRPSVRQEAAGPEKRGRCKNRLGSQGEEGSVPRCTGLTPELPYQQELSPRSVIIQSASLTPLIPSLLPEGASVLPPRVSACAVGASAEAAVGRGTEPGLFLSVSLYHLCLKRTSHCPICVGNGVSL